MDTTLDTTQALGTFGSIRAPFISRRALGLLGWIHSHGRGARVRFYPPATWHEIVELARHGLVFYDRAAQLVWSSAWVAREAS